jgi:hypothetical protein
VVECSLSVHMYAMCSRHSGELALPFIIACSHCKMAGEHGFPCSVLVSFGRDNIAESVPRHVLPFKSGLTACTRVQPSEM